MRLWTLKRWLVMAAGATLLLGLPGAGAVNMLQSPISAEAESAEALAVDDVVVEDPSPVDDVIDEPTTTTVVEPNPDARPTGEARERARAALRRCLAHHNVPDIDRLLAEHSPRELLRRCLAHHRCERRNGEATEPDAAPVDADLTLEDVTVQADAVQSDDASTDRPERCRRPRRPGAEPPVGDQPTDTVDEVPSDDAPADDASSQVSRRAAGSRRR